MKSTKNNHVYGGHISDSEVALYVDSLYRDDLSPLPAAVLDHVEACPGCKDKILDLFLFLKNPDSSGFAPIREKVVEMPAPDNRRFYTRKAAAVFFILALLLTAYFLIFKKDFSTGRQVPAVKDNESRQQVTQTLKEPRQESPGQDVKIQKEQGVKKAGKETQDNLPPVNYRVNPNLENMIGSQSRSAAVHVISPQNNIYLTKDILFSWEETRQKPLHLKILNNKNEILFEYEIEENQVVFKEKLGPGLYYWKLENMTDLLYVGKFFIK